jgi:hypothetical protein
MMKGVGTSWCQLLKMWVKGCLNETGVVWKSGDRLCGLRGMGASGSHLGTLGGRGVVGCYRAQYLTYTIT